jgi:hypothetical protein
LPYKGTHPPIFIEKIREKREIRRGGALLAIGLASNG